MSGLAKALIKGSRKYKNLCIKSPNILECKYKHIKYRNVLSRLNQIRKTKYFHNNVTSFKGDSMLLRQFLNGYIHRQSYKNEIVKSLIVNGVNVTEKMGITSNLNLHFSTFS